MLSGLFLLVGCHHFSPSTSYPNKLTSPYKTATDDSTLYGNTSPFLMPYNRVIDGAGQSVSFGDAGVENHSLDAVLLPDKKTIVVEDRFGIAFFDVKQRQLLFRWDYTKSPNLRGSMSSFSGIKAVVYHDSTYVFWGAGGRGKPNSYVMQAVWDGSRARLVRTIPFEPVAPATIALPNEVVVREEAGELYLYTVLNGNNQLVKIRVNDQRIIWTVPTGVAPFGLTISRDKAYVTNWAGPVPDSTNGLETAGVPWGSAYIDPKTGAMARGTVSVIDIIQGKAERELSVGLHPNAIISSPDGRFLYVANGNSDYVSVINEQTQQVTDSIFVGLFNTGNGYIGSTPNALAISPQGTTLYVANGLDNAICVVELGSKASGSGQGDTKIRGYIPTQAYPSGIVLNDTELYVTNLEAVGARIANPVDQGGQGKNPAQGTIKAYNSHKQLASVSFIPVPDEPELAALTEKVKKQSLQFRLALTEQLPRPNATPKTRSRTHWRTVGVQTRSVHHQGKSDV